MSVLADTSDWRVLFYGQSWVAASVTDSLTERTMRDRQIPWRTTAIGGYSFQALTGLTSSRVIPYGPLTAAGFNILYLVGGTGDYSAGRTGAQCVADQITIADTARANGFTYVITCTTPASTTIVGADDTRRLDGNTTLKLSTSLVANGGKFDAVVQLAEDTALADAVAANDGIHPGAVGLPLAAALTRVPLDTITA